ncbi:MAG TPA: GDP-L-fucose synthase [Rhizomicrobium sp.]|nr:GDP-L-fucose synthase [Rhizomicrobium sp.]
MRNGAKSPYSIRGKRVWIAGHRGMVGAALVRRLASEDCEILTVERNVVDLRNAEAVGAWMRQEKPQVVLLAAAKVGGILANDTRPVDFLRDNLLIETHVIQAAFETGVEKLLFLGSSCIYPKFAPQPIAEDALLTGLLEATNEAYAIAKIAGIKLCQAYRRQYGSDFNSAMPTNLYGPHDNFDLASSHVLPALIRKMDDARRAGDDHVVVWGSGKPRREFLHVDDCADALIHLLVYYSGDSHVNVGCGEDVTVLQLADLVRHTVGFRGEIQLDASKPDGTPRKLLDIGALQTLGWRPRISLKDGIKTTYDWYLANRNDN